MSHARAHVCGIRCADSNRVYTALARAVYLRGDLSVGYALFLRRSSLYIISRLYLKGTRDVICRLWPCVKSNRNNENNIYTRERRLLACRISAHVQLITRVTANNKFTLYYALGGLFNIFDKLQKVTQYTEKHTNAFLNRTHAHTRRYNDYELNKHCALSLRRNEKRLITRSGKNVYVERSRSRHSFFLKYI